MATSTRVPRTYSWPQTLRLSTRPPKLVYLDLLHWVSLAKYTMRINGRVIPKRGFRHGPIRNLGRLQKHRELRFSVSTDVTIMPTVVTPTRTIVVSRSPGPASDIAGYASNVTAIMAQTDFSAFTNQLEGYVHNGIHVWVGGSMSSVPTAPADPLFWMHHGNIDRLWSVWQGSAQGAAKNPGLVGADGGHGSLAADRAGYSRHSFDGIHMRLKTNRRS